MSAALANAVGAMPDGQYMADLARAVSNDDSTDGAARYLLSRVSDFLRQRGQAHGPIEAFDFAIHDIEAICEIWTAFHFAAEQFCFGVDHLPALARFIADRLPVVWDRPNWCWHRPTTRALALAERIDTLVGMFAVGLQPNGSKDPFALRRGAKEVLLNVVPPLGVAA